MLYMIPLCVLTTLMFYVYVRDDVPEMSDCAVPPRLCLCDVNCTGKCRLHLKPKKQQ